jgi:hypothetical protein
MMAGTVTSSEEAQLLQTIEMFEVITQSQPQDYQSLEILKEAYAKLDRESEVVRTAKRIAQVYITLGQLSSAILEYESILQRYPDDPDVLGALSELQTKADSLGRQPVVAELHLGGPARQIQPTPAKAGAAPTPPGAGVLEDGNKEMYKLFVDGKVITAKDFELCWKATDRASAPHQPVDPFVHTLAAQGLVPIERALRLISDKTRVGFVPLERYDIEMEIGRKWPRAMCLRWCVLPFDRMSKAVLVATCNPFNRQATADIEELAHQRIIWYLALPEEIMKALRKLYR